MSVRGWRFALWLCLLTALPVPILVLGPGYVPVLRLSMLALVAAAVLVFEHWGGAVPLLVVVLAAQSAVYAATLWLIARAVVAVSARLGRPGRILTTGIVALLGIASCCTIYRDPYRADSPDVDLARLYQ